tara:strand:- start:83 stop:316 length:234 start_codon:yes stop_codon:yes gene_type:complete
MPIIPSNSYLTIISLTALFTFIALVVTRYFVHQPKKRSIANRALLRGLLEEFGLEIPSELENANITDFRSMKPPING